MTPARRPDPPPMKTDDVKIAAAGTAAWAVALVVLLLVGLPRDDRWWLWVCVAGIVTGLFGMWYIPRLQASRARKAAALAAKHQASRRDPAQHAGQDAGQDPGGDPAGDSDRREASRRDATG